MQEEYYSEQSAIDEKRNQEKNIWRFFEVDGVYEIRDWHDNIVARAYSRKNAARITNCRNGCVGIKHPSRAISSARKQIAKMIGWAYRIAANPMTAKQVDLKGWAHNCEQLLIALGEGWEPKQKCTIVKVESEGQE